MNFQSSVDLKEVSFDGAYSPLSYRVLVANFPRFSPSESLSYSKVSHREEPRPRLQLKNPQSQPRGNHPPLPVARGSPEGESHASIATPEDPRHNEIGLSSTARRLEQALATSPRREQS